MGHTRKTSSASAVCGILALMCAALLAGMGLEYSLRLPAAVVVVTPAPAAPAAPVTVIAKHAKARLAQVKKDWGIEGRLVCHTELP
jgi:cobalamin biosynthesis protein CbiD